MNGDTTTGTPLALARWQQPAALINAGRVTPDPYPLEQILYCATCGQQFFGTHLAGGVCVEGGAHLTGNIRVYRPSCDCRPGPLPANDVELRVYAETHVHAFGTDTVAGLTTAHYALLAIRIFTRIEVGLTVDNIAFTNRI
jgi:hypothetical protein